MAENISTPSLVPNDKTVSLQGLTREERLARMNQHIESVQEQNPESDFKTNLQWWVPSVNLGADLQESLDQETYDKLNTCIAKVFEHKFAPDAIAEARSEMKTILVGHPDILERVDTMIFGNDQILASVHEYAKSEAAAGREVFGSCPTAAQK